uniref:Zinc finger CCCH domain-containing protein 14 n=1 Tax=Plectus sambesii TaxID=2011161 RepID=A0A914VRV4_9BILA
MSSHGGSEVSKKIRAAIKAKLVELGAYVDEELPDYIMVMIANKKTKQQMQSDLQLFLAKNAFKFVEWLFDIFDRLQAVGKPEKESKDERAKTASRDKKERDSKTEKGDRKEKEREREVASHKSLKEKPRSSKMAETVTHSERKATSTEKSKEHRSKEPRYTVPSDEEHVEADLEMHAEPIGDAIDAEIYEADAKAKEQRLKDEKQQQRSKEHRRMRTPPRSPTHHGKRNIGRVQPMRQEPVRHEPVQHEEKPRPTRSTLMPISSVVRVASQKAEVQTRKEQRRPSAAEMAPRPSLFLKAMHDASVSATLRPPTVPKEKKVAPKRRKSDSSESDDSPQRSHSHQKKTRRQETEKPKTPSAEKRKHHREHSSPSKRRVELKYEEDDDTEALIVDGESEKKIETKTRFVITMSGLSGPFHSKYGVPIDEEELEDADEPEETPPVAKIVAKPKAGQPSPPKLTVIKRLTERVSTRPVKLRLAHHQKQEEVHVEADEEPEDEAIVADNFHEDRIATTDSSNGQTVERTDTRNVVKASEAGQTPVWTGHFNPVSITLDDDDEEEEIDAMMANNANGNFVSGSFDATELPPTHSMSRPAAPQAADKVLERCKFWPACRQGDSCTYLHPIKHCLTFPKCTFGDKCLYIHPNCKFDQACTRPNCPYTHAGKKAASGTVMPPARPPYTTKIAQDFSTVPIPCKFAGKCTNVRCPFKHPKPCRFAAECLNPTCPFAHPKKRDDSPTNVFSAKYKWKADNPASVDQEKISSVSSIAA